MKNNNVPLLSIILSIALLVLAVSSAAYVPVGLIYDVIGVLFLGWHEMASTMTHLKSAINGSSGAQSWDEFKDLGWHLRFLLSLALQFGSPEDAMVTKEHPIVEFFAIKTWGLGFLILGFIFQAVGSF